MKLIKRKLRKGFTLVELVVTIAIIAILSAASVATYFGVTESARRSTAQSNANEVARAIQVGATIGETFESTSTGISIKTDGSNDAEVIRAYLGEQNITVAATDFYEVAGEGVEIGDETIATLAYKASNGNYYFTIDCTDFSISELLDTAPTAVS